MRFVFKVVLLGAPAVGKTSLVLRFVENKFKDEYITTLGADFLIKEIVFEKVKIKVKLLLWDIGGQERWKSIRPTYLTGADGAIIAFDLTRQRTFEEIPRWIEDLRTYCLTDEKVPYVLVGNKHDLESLELREVDQEMINEYLRQNTTHYFSTSAKTGENVERMFQIATFEILKRKAELERKRKYLRENMDKIMDILEIDEEKGE